MIAWTLTLMDYFLCLFDGTLEFKNSHLFHVRIFQNQFYHTACTLSRKIKNPHNKKREFDVTEKYSDNYKIKYVIPSEVRNLQKILRRCRSSEWQKEIFSDVY